MASLVRISWGLTLSPVQLLRIHSINLGLLIPKELSSKSFARAPTSSSTGLRRSFANLG
ncbi:hypothetical protein NF27_EU00010 [Candidatus Jidaibacter acanthamoeba]|uniref:Uncharacterized protein n=1 Tax=Candidatus Jidaibacter acanthamoebae TaxID=86105 RepID=A0A0C1MYX0_9RICK|nr:hypothetical protein [Candidatus Jidaibacter acanthamoeba]KIE05151.1 hypothetical protein NF27_EU00010 [Candidatus Jidaibacter acanthamoeba]